MAIGTMAIRNRAPTMISQTDVLKRGSLCNRLLVALLEELAGGRNSIYSYQPFAHIIH
jgi:hypothetical protein